MAAKVLVVDDQEGIRKLLKEVFEELGYQAEAVATGEEAIQAVSEGSFKLILMDMKMPGLSGFETAEKLKALNGSLMIVLMTGFYDDFLLQEIKRYGVDGLINKPFNLEEIQKILEETFA